MARRNFWTIVNGKVSKGAIDFKWESGISVSQKRRSCLHLHSALNQRYDLYPALDISSASPESLGVKLSAFNLMWKGKTIECWYQGSKVYSIAGHMKHIYDVDSMTAKKSMKQSGKGALIGFRLVDTDYPMQPKTVFYDWLYLQGLMEFEERDAVLRYNVFTDVQATEDVDACQARAVCIYKLLHEQDILHIANDFEVFKIWHSEYVEDIYSEKANMEDIRTLPDGSYKILDTQLNYFTNVLSCFHQGLVFSNGVYKLNALPKVDNPQVVVYTDGLLDDLCAIEYLSKKYSKAVVVLTNYGDLNDSNDYAPRNYSIVNFQNDIRRWFKESVVVFDDCRLEDVCNVGPDTVIYCLSKATATVRDMHLFVGNKLYAMIGKSTMFVDKEEEWNAAQDLSSYKTLQECIRNTDNWKQYTAVMCETHNFYKGSVSYLKYINEYMSQMEKLNENNCCYDLQCVLMSLE